MANEHNVKLAKDLREFADVLEKYEDTFAAYNELSFTTYPREKEGMANFAKTFQPVTKEECGEDGLQLFRMFGKLKVCAYILKSNVCRKVVKTVTQEVEVWECDPILEVNP